MKKVEDDIRFKLFRRVVGLTILNHYLSTLFSLLETSVSGNQQAAIKEISSHLLFVLEVLKSSAKPLRLFHPSFHDFLLSRRRSEETQLQGDNKHAHRAVVNHSLRGFV